MHPMIRLWGWTAVVVAVLLCLRGAWVPALACFLMSPAPALVWAQAGAAPGAASTRWLRGIALALVVLVAAYVAIVALGGIPPMHEWRGSAGR